MIRTKPKFTFGCAPSGNSFALVTEPANDMAAFVVANCSFPLVQLRSPVDTNRATCVACANLGIRAIHIGWNIAQIAYGVVRPVAVNVIDLMLRPLAMSEKPNKAMNSVFAAFQNHKQISALRFNVNGLACITPIPPSPMPVSNERAFRLMLPNESAVLKINKCENFRGLKSMRFKRDGRRCHAACRVRFSAASAARLSSVAHPLDANVAHWSLGILSRKIHERTVCGETEQIEATVSGVPAFFTMVA